MGGGGGGGGERLTAKGIRLALTCTCVQFTVEVVLCVVHTVAPSLELGS